ncbi:unnamed protein product [Ceratitis capitata]|uniref:(Mediterranean fruit fly) hypothetical protein n=1 Tax=Ceratitis capitata TaxID=7213 RepID=A0A811U416_CERCA|nr:unnamed protein product [Ceratitis capitata]
MFACNLRSMKLPLSPALGGFMSSYASVAASALTSVSSQSQSQSQSLNCCKCDAREVKMSVDLHNRCSSRSQGQMWRCVGLSSKCGNGISNFTQCLITCGLLLLLAAGNEAITTTANIETLALPKILALP